MQTNYTVLLQKMQEEAKLEAKLAEFHHSAMLREYRQLLAAKQVAGQGATKIEYKQNPATPRTG